MKGYHILSALIRFNYLVDKIRNLKGFEPWVSRSISASSDNFKSLNILLVARKATTFLIPQLISQFDPAKQSCGSHPKFQHLRIVLSHKVIAFSEQS